MSDGKTPDPLGDPQIIESLNMELEQADPSRHPCSGLTSSISSAASIRSNGEDRSGVTAGTGKHLLLKSSKLAIAIVPAEGGRVTSLRCNRTNVEFLTEARANRAPFERGMQASFQDGPTAGIEECLPTVGACSDETGGGAVPDHGDFWQLEWKVLRSSSSEVTMECDGFSRPLRMRKEFSVAHSSFRIAYTVTNIGVADVSMLYACHPLFAVDTGDRICLPPEVTRMRVDYDRGGRIGAKGDVIAWPEPVTGVLLDETQAADAGVAVMLYTERLLHGVCGLYRSRARQGIVMRFDPAVLPFLGVWLCYGGWPEQPGYPKQYAVAMEPTFASVNTLAAAQRNGQSRLLRPGEAVQWEIVFEVSEPGLSLKEFRCCL